MPLLVLAAACGRTGIDRETGPSDAALDSPAIDAPAVLACNPPRFQVADTMSTLSAIATPAGFDVFPVDSGAVVHGLAYAMSGSGSLGAASNDVTVGQAAAGPVGVTVAGDNVVVSMPFNSGTPGTQLIQLDRSLTAVGPKIMITNWSSPNNNLTGMVAYNGIDSVALLGGENGGFSARLVSLDGVISPSHPVINGVAPAAPQGATIVRAGSGYVVSWWDGQSGELDAELLDDNLAVVQPAVKLGQASGTPPRVAYLASAKRYGVTWWQKIGGIDYAFVGVFDASFAPVAEPVNVGAGTFSNIIAGDSDFLVVWDGDAMTAPALGAARVLPDGSMVQLGIANSGGKQITWDLVSRAGQPALVWLEGGGTAPNLWIDPLCTNGP